jgi:hypothetical protein
LHPLEKRRLFTAHVGSGHLSRAEHRAEHPQSAGEDADKLEVLESVARDTVEPVGLARDLDAREGEDTDYKADRQP